MSPPGRTSYTRPLRRVCLFLVGCCVELVGWRPPKATICFIFLIFCRLFRRPKRCEIVPPILSAAFSSRNNTSPHHRHCLLVECCVSLEKVLPTRSNRSRLISNSLPPQLQPTFGWLLFLLTKRPPPQVKAPPISQFFDGCTLGAQNKVKESGENEPRTLAPEQDAWGATAP